MRLSPEDKERIFRKIQDEGHSHIEEKELDVLGKIFQSSAMTKALGKIYVAAQEACLEMMNLNFASEDGRHQGTRLQGRAQGALATIDALLDLAVEDEDEIEVEENE